MLSTPVSPESQMPSPLLFNIQSSSPQLHAAVLTAECQQLQPSTPPGWRWKTKEQLGGGEVDGCCLPSSQKGVLLHGFDGDILAISPPSHPKASQAESLQSWKRIDLSSKMGVHFNRGTSCNGF